MNPELQGKFENMLSKVSRVAGENPVGYVGITMAAPTSVEDELIQIDRALVSLHWDFERTVIRGKQSYTFFPLFF